MSFVSFLVVFSFSPPLSLSLPNFAFHVHHISLVFRFIYPSIRLHILFIFSNLCYCVYYATLDGHRAYFSPVCVSLPRLLVIVVMVVIRSFLCANKWEGRKKEVREQKVNRKRGGGIEMVCVLRMCVFVGYKYWRCFCYSQSVISNMSNVCKFGCVRKCERMNITTQNWLQ